MNHVALAARGLGTVLLLLLVWNGISGGLREFPRADSLGQQVQTVAQLLYGGFAALVLLTTRQSRGIKRSVRALWVLTVSLAAGIAPVAWGGTGVLTGVMTFVLSAVVASGIVALLDVGGPVAQRQLNAVRSSRAVQSPTVAHAAVPSSTQRSS